AHRGAEPGRGDVVATYVAGCGTGPGPAPARRRRTLPTPTRRRRRTIPTPGCRHGRGLLTLARRRAQRAPGRGATPGEGDVVVPHPGLGQNGWGWHGDGRGRCDARGAAREVACRGPVCGVGVPARGEECAQPWLGPAAGSPLHEP